MKLIAAFTVAGGLLSSAACEHHFKSDAKEIAVDAKVTITQNSAGEYDFKYDAPFADSDGNFDFSKGEAYGKSVRLQFIIASDSGLGVKFKPNGADAIWIVDKKNVGPDGSPQGPYRGEQFSNFAVDASGQRLTLFNKNEDGILYRYGLRFDRGSETVIDDPDANNSGHGSGGGN